MTDAVSLMPGRRPGRVFAFSRLAVALVLSALVHWWLAAGMTIEAPAQAPQRGPAILDARLEAPQTPSEKAAFPQSESEPAASAGRRHSRSDRGPVFDAGRDTPVAKPSPAPEVAAGAPEARAVRQPAPFPDPTYYPARQLDAYPALMHPVRLDYPERALRDKVSGKILVMLFIDETGGVNEVAIVESEPQGYFEDTVLHVLAGARFFPARKDGRAVKSRVLVGINYHPGEAEGVMR